MSVCLSVCLSVLWLFSIVSYTAYQSHFSFTNNFGVLGILDHLHGTDVEFRKHISSKRHFTLKGFASAKEVVPDAKED